MNDVLEILKQLQAEALDNTGLTLDQVVARLDSAMAIVEDSLE